VYVANESAFRIRIPRSDVALSFRGQPVPGGLPIESWASFSPDIRGGALMMGALQLLEAEVNPVASVVLDAGLNINGLANTRIGDQPRLMTMNVGGTGSFDQLATGYRKALDAIAAVRTKTLGSRSPFPKISAIDAEPIDAILSMKGTVTNGVYHASIGQISVLNNTPFGKEMGAATSLTFVGTNQDAILEGEIVATAAQVQRVLKALRTGKLDLVSIRNHTIGEHPELFFVRFTGTGSATDLAKALRNALDVQIGALKPA